MQIILLEKIANVGNLGDVVKVKEGYARNFLIPQGKAKRATPENLKAEVRRTELEKAQAETLGRAQERGAKLDGLMVQIVQKAGVDGRLFGSVTNYDIVEALTKQGHEVERSQVRMPDGPLAGRRAQAAGCPASRRHCCDQRSGPGTLKDAKQAALHAALPANG
jgi:large subunit ribosomal protein L9